MNKSVNVKTLLQFVAIFAVCGLMVGGGYFISTRTTHAAAPSNATVVCPPNSYASPLIVQGIPKQVTPSQGYASVLYADGYVLSLKQAPSLYLGVMGAIAIKDGVVLQYAPSVDPKYSIVTDKGLDQICHPSPTTPTPAPAPTTG